MYESALVLTKVSVNLCVQLLEQYQLAHMAQVLSYKIWLHKWWEYRCVNFVQYMWYVGMAVLE